MNDGKSIDSAEIVTIGTEMLLGDLVDTNTAWISQRLAELGVGIYRHTTVGDNTERIVGALREASSRSALVVTTSALSMLFPSFMLVFYNPPDGGPREN